MTIHILNCFYCKQPLDDKHYQHARTTGRYQCAEAGAAVPVQAATPSASAAIRVPSFFIVSFIGLERVVGYFRRSVSRKVARRRSEQCNSQFYWDCRGTY